MKLFTKTRTLMLVLSLLLATIPATAVERPMALKGAGVATLITDDAGNPIGAIPTGSGTATHLGQWTVSGKVNYTPDADGVIHSSGEGTLTAANGDKLNIKIEGILNPVAGVDQGVFYFIGGTGRFESATGSVNFVVTVNFLTGGFDLTAVGKIDY